MRTAPCISKGRNFEFVGRAYNAFLAISDCAFVCDPGETISIDMVVNGSDLPGIAIRQGEAYTDVGSLLGVNNLSLEIAGIGALPQKLDERLTRRRVIYGRLTGTFTHAVDVPFDYVSESIEADVKAIVTVEQENAEYGYRPGWIVTHVTYKVIR